MAAKDDLVFSILLIYLVGQKFTQSSNCQLLHYLSAIQHKSSIEPKWPFGRYGLPGVQTVIGNLQDFMELMLLFCHQIISKSVFSCITLIRFYEYYIGHWRLPQQRKSQNGIVCNCVSTEYILEYEIAYISA